MTLLDTEDNKQPMVFILRTLYVFCGIFMIANMIRQKPSASVWHIVLTNVASILLKTTNLTLCLQAIEAWLQPQA